MFTGDGTSGVFVCGNKASPCRIQFKDIKAVAFGWLFLDDHGPDIELGKLERRRTADVAFLDSSCQRAFGTYGATVGAGKGGFPRKGPWL